MKIEWFETTPKSQWQLKTQEVCTCPDAQAPTVAVECDGGPWEGFGGCFNELGWLALQTLEGEVREKVLRKLFHPEDDCRLTLCRIPIGASDYAESWYSCNETEGDFAMRNFTLDRDLRYLIPYIRAAQIHQPQLRFFASPWSPPTWMKTPMAYNFGRFRMEPDYLDAYALYFLKFLQGYAREGVEIRQIHVQNEPVADQKFPSCVWSGEGLRDFIRGHLGPLMRKENPGCEIWLGTLNTDDYDGFVLPVLADEAARSFLSGVSYQWAGKAAIQRTHQSWPSLRLMQSENECGDGENTWTYAHYVFGLFRHYISNGANSYIYWNMVLPPGGSSTWGWKQNALITVDSQTGAITLNPEYFVMKHFSHFVREGAVMLTLRGPMAGNAVAFRNTDHSIVVIAANPLTCPLQLAFQYEDLSFDAELQAQSFHTFRIR